MGTEVFDLSWVQAVVKLFSLSGWSLFVVEKLLFDYYSIDDIKFYKLLKTPLCKVRNFSYEFVVLSKNEILRDF